MYDELKLLARLFVLKSKPIIRALFTTFNNLIKTMSKIKEWKIIIIEKSNGYS